MRNLIIGVSLAVGVAGLWACGASQKKSTAAPAPAPAVVDAGAAPVVIPDMTTLPDLTPPKPECEKPEDCAKKGAADAGMQWACTAGNCAQEKAPEPPKKGKGKKK